MQFIHKWFQNLDYYNKIQNTYSIQLTILASWPVCRNESYRKSINQLTVTQHSIQLEPSQKNPGLENLKVGLEAEA